jgi:hypothetical protein
MKAAGADARDATLAAGAWARARVRRQEELQMEHAWIS